MKTIFGTSRPCLTPGRVIYPVRVRGQGEGVTTRYHLPLQGVGCQAGQVSSRLVHWAVSILHTCVVSEWTAFAQRDPRFSSVVQSTGHNER